MLLAEAAGGKPFQLILLDATMPRRDGFWLAEQIEADPALNTATIMMLTALRRPDDADRCRKIGVHAYLAKPIKPSELLDAMMAAMGPLVGKRYNPGSGASRTTAIAAGVIGGRQSGESASGDGDVGEMGHTR